MPSEQPTPSVLTSLFGDRAPEFLEHYPRRPFRHDGPRERLPAFAAELSVTALGQIYRGEIGLHGRDSRPVTVRDPDPDTIAWLAQRSDGLTFERIERLVPGLQAWSRELAERLRLPRHAGAPRCNAFCSPGAAGYPPHFHYEGALLVQLRGRKRVRLGPVDDRFPVVQTDANRRFEVGFGLEPRPMAAYAQFAASGFPSPPGDDQGELHELAPGSVLYIPPGYWHGTRVEDGESLAFSFFLPTPRLYEGYLRALELALITDPAWREPMAAPGADATSTQRLEVMRERLAQVAEQLRPEDLRLCLGGDDSLTLQSSLCPNLDVRWSLEPGPDGVAFRIHAERQYEFEAEEPAAGVLASLLRRTTPFTVEEARREAAAEPEIMTDAIELLVELGALVRAPFALPAVASTVRLAPLRVAR